MKKWIALLLAAVMCLSLAACGEQKGSESESLTTESEPVEPTSKEDDTIHKLEESIETDILGLTLENAQLAIKLNTSGTATYEEMQKGIVHIGSDYFTADDYNASEDLGKAYVAPKGHTYVVIQYYAENLDRASVSFEGAFDGQFITVEYNGETYTGATEYGAESADGLEWEKYEVANVLLRAGESVHLRGFIDIPIDAEDLNDDFDLIFSLPASDGTTVNYRYQVHASDRAEAEAAEISLDEALYEFTSSEAQEYFKKHIGEFDVLTADEIAQNIIGEKLDTTIINGNLAWKGKFEFESGGAIRETIYDGSTGYFNNRTWALDGDSLVLDGTAICEVHNVTENVYLLYKDGAPYALLQK